MENYMATLGFGWVYLQGALSSSMQHVATHSFNQGSNRLMIHLLTLLTVKIIQPINPKAFSRAAVKRMVQEARVNCALLFLGEIDSWIPQGLVRSSTSGTSSKESESLLALWLSNKAAMAVAKIPFYNIYRLFSHDTSLQRGCSFPCLPHGKNTWELRRLCVSRTTLQTNKEDMLARMMQEGLQPFHAAELYLLAAYTTTLLHDTQCNSMYS